MKKLKISILLLLIMTLLIENDAMVYGVAVDYETAPQVRTEKVAAYLSPAEREVLHELNLLRSNPKAYALHVIEPTLKYYEGRYYKHPGQVPVITDEGKKAVLECIKVLKSTPSLPLFSPSEGMTKAARDMVEDQSTSGSTGHKGSKGDSPFDRMNRYGKWMELAAENIDYGNASARDIVMALLIDDGVESRGHRKNLLNPKLLRVGIATGFHATYNYMCVIDFAGDYTEKAYNQ
jgi:uncharacterized protein YkwD